MRASSIASSATYQTSPSYCSTSTTVACGIATAPWWVLATHRKIPSKTICAFLGVAKAFVLKYRNKFKTSGTAAIFAPQTKSNRKIDDSDLRNAVFGLLHEPPTNHGINRTSWTMPLLSRVRSALQ